MPTAIEREAQAIKSEAKKILLIVVIISLVVYAFTGTVQVGEEETGMLIRFGRIVKELKPGLCWGFPWPIDNVVRIPTGVSHSLQVSSFNLDPEQVSAQMTELRQNNRRFKALPYSAQSALVDSHLATADLNVLHLDLQVVYTITDPVAYYLAAGHVRSISETNVQQIARGIIDNSLIRVIAGRQVMTVLGEDKSYIQQHVQQMAQEQFDSLALGITIRQPDAIQVTECRVPAALKPDFDRATTADEERKTLIQPALAEADQILRQAEAHKFDILTKAQSYLQATISQARGEADRFSALIKEYQDKGEVVRDRQRYEKLAEVAPYLKAPIVHAIRSPEGKQKLLITIPGKPE